VDLGWTDGRDVRIDLRWFGDDINQSRALAQELVGQQPDIILAFGPAATVALQRGCRKLKKPHKMRVSESSVLKSIKNRRARDRRGGVAGRGRYPVTARRRAPLASSPVIVLAHQLLDHVQQGNMRLRQRVHGGERRADDVAVLAMAGAGRKTIGSTFLAGFGAGSGSGAGAACASRLPSRQRRWRSVGVNGLSPMSGRGIAANVYQTSTRQRPARRKSSRKGSPNADGMGITSTRLAGPDDHPRDDVGQEFSRPRARPIGRSGTAPFGRAILPR
jgi:hypothetical protein